MKKIVLLIFFLVFLFNTDCLAQELNDESISEEAERIYESISFENISENIKNAFVSTFSPSFPIFLGLLSLVVIASLGNAFDFGFSGFDIGGYVSTICFSGCCFSVVKSLGENLENYISKLRDIMLITTPVLVSSSIAQGAAQAQSGYSGLVITLTVAEFLVSKIALPCVKVLFALSLVSCLCRNCIDLKGISSAIKTFSVFSVSLIMTGVVTVLHFQNVLARAADSVGLRAVKFVSASFIPIVGGLVGESVKTVTEALKAVRGMAGVSGVSAIIAACIPPLVALFIYKTEISVCSCLAKTLGCKNEAEILSEMGGILNVLNAALLASTIGFAAMICIVAHAV